MTKYLHFKRCNSNAFFDLWSVYCNAKRNSYIMALLAVLISDPISHTISQNIANNYHVPIGIDSFFSHIFINRNIIVLLSLQKTQNIPFMQPPFSTLLHYSRY